MSSIESIVAALQRAWNAGDSTAWAANFADDAVFVDVLGRVQQGRHVIAQEHRKIFDTIYRGSQIAIWPIASRSVGEDRLLVHTRSTLRVPSGPRAGTTEAIQTKLLEDRLIQTFHNTIRTTMAGFADHDADLAHLSPMDWQHTDT